MGQAKKVHVVVDHAHSFARHVERQQGFWQDWRTVSTCSESTLQNHGRSFAQLVASLYKPTGGNSSQ
jgi:hypothetical protein